MVEIEAEIKNLVENKTAGFKWRPNFKKWQKVRIYQEGFQAFRLGIIKEYVEKIDNKSILDLGCGMGGLITALKKENVKKIVGVDFDFDYCRISKLRLKRHNLDELIINGAGEKLPIRSGRFDVITCFEVLEHVEDDVQVLKEIMRVLKFNGCALITAPNRLGLVDPHYHLPFINWLPRSFAKIILIVFKRQAKGLFDNQELSKMHYYYYWQIRKQLKVLGFDFKDIMRLKLTDYKQIQTPLIRRIVYILTNLRLADFFYLVYACFCLDTFQFLLVKNPVKKQKLND